MRETERVLALAVDLVAVIAVNALCRDALHLAEVEQRLVAGLDRRRMTGRAHARTIGMLIDQAPASARAEVEIAKMTPRRRARVAALVPLAMNLLMAVGAVVFSARI